MKKLSLNSKNRIPGPDNTHIIQNPLSGGFKSNISQVNNFRMRLGIPEAHIHLTEKPGHATDIAQSISSANDSLIIAAGGDGTVNETARGLIDTNSILGILPLGSGNGFARHLKVPMSWQKLADNLPVAKVNRLDVGLFDKTPFLAVSSFGFSAFIADLFANFGARGPLPYFFLSVKSFFQYQPFQFELNCDGVVFEGKAFDISIANSSQFGNEAKIAPQASSEDGFLDVVIIEKPLIHRIPKLIYDLFKGKLPSNKGITYLRARKINLKIEPSNHFIHIDGEPLSRQSSMFSWQIKEKSLNVLDYR